MFNFRLYPKNTNWIQAVVHKLNQDHVLISMAHRQQQLIVVAEWPAVPHRTVPFRQRTASNKVRQIEIDHLITPALITVNKTINIASNLV